MLNNNKIVTTESGLRILVRPMNTTRSVSVGVFVGAGSMTETTEEGGISHFIEHMLFKGTEKRTAFEIAEEMECLGVQINAYTSRNMTVYYTSSLDEHAEACAELLSDLYFNSTFLKENLKKEQGVVLEEIGMCEDDPEDLAFELAGKAHFGNAPIARPILGTKKSVKSFDKAAIEDYMARHYTPENTVVVFSGHITEEFGKKLAEKYFGSKMKKTGYVRSEPPKAKPQKGFLKKIKNIEQANVVLTFPSAPFRTEDADAISYLHLILGGGMSSRLFQRVREQEGLAYSVYTLPLEYLNDGFFTIYLGTNPASLERALVAVRETVAELKRDGITEKEFLKAREQLKSGLVLGGESASALMRASGKIAILCNEVFDLDEKLKRIEAVTKEDVMRVLHRYLDTEQVSAGYVGKKTGVNILGIIKGE